MRRVLSGLVLALCLVPSVRLQSSPKVLLIVWDGSEYTIVEPLFREGRLPNLARVSPTLRMLSVEKPCFDTGRRNCDCMTTETKPQFATMLTGVEADVHGVFTNRCFQQVPAGLTIPEKLEAANPAIRTGHISSKVANPGDEVFDNLSKAVDFYVSDFLDPEAATGITINKINEWAAQSFFLMVHFREPDRTGHLQGYTSASYRDRLLEDDQQLGRILEALQTQGLLDQTRIYVISDHGFGVPGGPTAIRPFLHTNSPRAIFVSNDPAGRDGLRMRDIAPLILQNFQ